MKALITVDGILHINPENEIERFALRKWWEDFSSKESKGVGILANYLEADKNND